MFMLIRNIMEKKAHLRVWDREDNNYLHLKELQKLFGMTNLIINTVHKKQTHVLLKDIMQWMIYEFQNGKQIQH